MAKVTNPLLSGEVRGAFGKKMIFRKGGVVTRMFSPKNPRSAAQQAHRIAFKEYYMSSLTQAQADLLYAAIIHQHDDLYSLFGHGHDHGGLSGLDDDDHAQYFNQERGDTRYLHGHTFLFPFATYANGNPITSTPVYPYGGTVEAAMSFSQLVQAVFVLGANSAVNYYTLTFAYRPNMVGTSNDLVIATMNTKTAVSAFNGYTFSSTTFVNSSVPGTGYLYMSAVRTGTPGDIYITCPALRCQLN